MAKKKTAAKFKSHSTPGHQMDLSAWLVELVMTRQNQGVKLPPRFWTDTRWKFKFGREIQALRKFIKEYGEKALLKIALKNYLTTWTDYPQMQVFLQQSKERLERLALPKDFSDVRSEKITEDLDLRESREIKPKKKGLFERMRELNDNTTFSN